MKAKAYQRERRAKVEAKAEAAHREQQLKAEASQREEQAYHRSSCQDYTF